MLIDLHNHTAASPDATATLTDYERAYAAGRFDVVAITDHHTLEGALAFRRAASFPVIVGEEILTADGEVIGLFLERPIERGLSAVETIRRIKAQGGLVYIPHPFLRLIGDPIRPGVLPAILPAVDLLEVYNAVIPFDRDNQLAAQFSRQAGLAGAAGSDAHYTVEIGCGRMDVELAGPEAALDPERLCRALRTGRLIAAPAPLAGRLARRALQLGWHRVRDLVSGRRDLAARPGSS